ncbi:MAG: nucleotide exchange factor GrpE [Ilumatobacteraceae bacterium]
MSDTTPSPASEGLVNGEDQTVEPADALVDEADTTPLSELEIALVERDEWMDRAQRIAADFENFRRRHATQRADDIDRATGRLAEALLPVLDACEAAFLQHPAEIEPLFNLMLSELKKQGLESMNLHEQPFDPHLADAVLHEPGDGDPVVSEVLRSGYMWNGKVLRPAMVKVRG